VTSRSRSNSRATTTQAAQSIASRPPAKAAASPKLGLITWNDISAASATGGRLPRMDSCCATRVSLALAEAPQPPFHVPAVLSAHPAHGAAARVLFYLL
jgi:hypothetical protein